MITFEKWYEKVSGGHQLPKDNINGEWFAERGLPMIVECTCCGSTMVLPSAYVDDEDYTYCKECAGVD